jgi:hypothetical protein
MFMQEITYSMDKFALSTGDAKRIKELRLYANTR